MTLLITRHGPHLVEQFSVPVRHRSLPPPSVPDQSCGSQELQLGGAVGYLFSWNASVIMKTIFLGGDIQASSNSGVSGTCF